LLEILRGKGQKQNETLALFEKFRQRRLSYEKNWILNWLFYAGKQWYDYNTSQGKLEDLKEQEPVRNALHFIVQSNRITQDVQRIVAFLMRIDPWMEVVPLSNETSDVQMAKAQSRVIQHVLQKNKFQDVKYRKFLTTYVMYGIASLYINKKYADRIIGIKDGKPIRDVDIGIEVINPFEFWIDPTIDEWEKHDHVFIGRKLDTSRDVVLIIEHYRKPSFKNKGFYEVFLPEGKILKRTDWPFPHKKLPLIWGTYYYTPDAPYGLGGVITHARSLQKLINFSYSLMLENLFLMGHGKILAPKGAIKNPPTNAPGEVIEYDATAIGLKPEFVMGVGLPGSYHDMMNRIIAEYNENVQVAEVLRGYAPATDPAKKVQIKTVQAAEIFVPSTAGLEFILREAGEQILSLAKELYSVKDKVRIIGPDSKPIVEKIDTAKWPSEFDVVVKVGAQLPISKQVMNQLQFEDAIARYRSNPMDVEAQQIMEFYFQLAGVPFQSQRFLLDSSLQKWENGQMLEGKSVPVFEWHNHAVHLAVLYQLLKSPDFYNLDPVVQRLLLDHRDKHDEYLKMQMMQMLGQGQPQGGQSAQVETLQDLLMQNTPKKGGI